jgi:hypothetical protein
MHFHQIAPCAGARGREEEAGDGDEPDAGCPSLTPPQHPQSATMAGSRRMLEGGVGRAPPCRGARGGTGGACLPWIGDMFAT